MRGVRAAGGGGGGVAQALSETSAKHVQMEWAMDRLLWSRGMRSSYRVGDSNERADGQLLGALERSAGRDGPSISGVIPRVFRSVGRAPSTINEAAARAAEEEVMIPDPP